MNFKSLLMPLCCLTLVLSFIGCTKDAPEKSEPLTLVGKTFEYDYGTAAYRVNYKSTETLHWKAIKGEEAGKESDETYALQQLNPYTFFVSWIEADGLGVSLVLNLKEKKINAFLKIDAEIVPLSGTVTEIK